MKGEGRVLRSATAFFSYARDPQRREHDSARSTPWLSDHELFPEVMEINDKGGLMTAFLEDFNRPTAISITRRNSSPEKESSSLSHEQLSP